MESGISVSSTWHRGRHARSREGEGEIRRRCGRAEGHERGRLTQSRSQQCHNARITHSVDALARPGYFSPSEPLSQQSRCELGGVIFEVALVQPRRHTSSRAYKPFSAASIYCLSIFRHDYPHPRPDTRHYPTRYTWGRESFRDPIRRSYAFQGQRGHEWQPRYLRCASPSPSIRSRDPRPHLRARAFRM